MPQLITGMEMSHEFQLGPFLGNAFFVYTKYAYPPNAMVHMEKEIYMQIKTLKLWSNGYWIISKGKCTRLGVCLKQVSEFFVKTLETTFLSVIHEKVSSNDKCLSRICVWVKGSIH